MSFKYLALGDSYTIGESVLADQCWPYLLQNRLVGNSIPVDQLDIIATTGWTTDELLTAIKKEQPSADYDMVSLLIGVNNQYRGYKLEVYVSEFKALLTLAKGFAKGKMKNVFVVSIPDYGVTPFAKERDPEKISKEIDWYNTKARSICEKSGTIFINITTYSRNALKYPSLLAQDGLHPSAKMYAQWVDKIYPTVWSVLF